MPNIKITVKNKIATNPESTEYICGNSDFVIDFDFDAEWDAYETKTARFIYGGGYQDIIFQGSQCAVPVISNTNTILCGVYAGDLHTTTPALIRARKGILCGNSAPADPAPDVYAQMMELINSMGEVDPEAIAAAVADYMAENPVKVPVQSVNGKTGAVKLTSWDVDAAGAVITIDGATNESTYNAVGDMYNERRPYLVKKPHGSGVASLAGVLLLYYPLECFKGSGYTQYRGIAVSVDDGAVYQYTSMLDWGVYKFDLNRLTPDPAFIVSITYSEETDAYSADHTFQQILTAHEAGRIVQAEYDGAFFNLNWIAEDAITFAATYSADGSGLKQDILMISADGCVYLDSIAPPVVPSSTSSDAGKFLRVGEDGSAAWETGNDWKLLTVITLDEDVFYVDIDLPQKWSRLWFRLCKSPDIYSDGDIGEAEITISACTAEYLSTVGGDTCSHYVYSIGKCAYFWAIVERTSDREFSAYASKAIKVGNSGYGVSGSASKIYQLEGVDVAHACIHCGANLGTTNKILSGTEIKIMYVE